MYRTCVSEGLPWWEEQKMIPLSTGIPLANLGPLDMNSPVLQDYTHVSRVLRDHRMCCQIPLKQWEDGERASYESEWGVQEKWLPNWMSGEKHTGVAVDSQEVWQRTEEQEAKAPQSSTSGWSHTSCWSSTSGWSRTSCWSSTSGWSRTSGWRPLWLSSLKVVCKERSWTQP